MTRPGPTSATVRACDGASVTLEAVMHWIEININGPNSWCNLTPHQARKLADKLVAMADAIEERGRMEKLKIKGGR